MSSAPSFLNVRAPGLWSRSEGERERSPLKGAMQSWPHRCWVPSFPPDEFRCARDRKRGTRVKCVHSTQPFQALCSWRGAWAQGLLHCWVLLPRPPLLRSALPASPSSCQRRRRAHGGQGSSCLEPANLRGTWYPCFSLYPQHGPQDPRKCLLNAGVLVYGVDA